MYRKTTSLASRSVPVCYGIRTRSIRTVRCICRKVSDEGGATAGLLASLAQADPSTLLRAGCVRRYVDSVSLGAGFGLGFLGWDFFEGGLYVWILGSRLAAEDGFFG